MEENIINYLTKKNNPEAILLIGSHAEGNSTEESDWDLILINPKNGIKSHFDEYSNSLLDITVKNIKDGDILTTAFKPVYSCKVLFDSTDGKLNDTLEATKKIYELGPLKAYQDGVSYRLQKNNRWYEKIKKHNNELEQQYYYNAFFYQNSLRLWFELQNQWSEPVVASIEIIRNKDYTFYLLLQKFILSSLDNRVDISSDILKHLEKLSY